LIRRQEARGLERRRGRRRKQKGLRKWFGYRKRDRQRG
jgi:hypothetical protein